MVAPSIQHAHRLGTLTGEDKCKRLHGFWTELVNKYGLSPIK
jgi:hypothetical protein